MDSQGIEGQKPQEKISPEKTAEHNLRREFDNQRTLGRAIIGLSVDREDQRLTPYIDSSLFPKDEMGFLQSKPEGQNIDQVDIDNATRVSFGLTLEAAAQIAEVQLPRHGQIREDPESLEQIMRMLKAGRNIGEDLLKNKPQVIEDETKKVVARRLKVTPDKVQMNQEQLINWSEQQLGTAYARIGRGAQAISGYLGR